MNSLAPYRIDENKIVLTRTVLGRGAFGLVFLGEMGRTLVAVKQLHATGTSAENKKLALVSAQVKLSEIFFFNDMPISRLWLKNYTFGRV